jgi:hypothetical protein
MCDDPATASSARELLPGARDGVGVDAISLADLMAQVRSSLQVSRIDFVKLDVEGAEHEVLPAIDAGALDGVVELQMEYHPRRPKAPLFEALQRAGLPCVRDFQEAADYGVAHFKRH